MEASVLRTDNKWLRIQYLCLVVDFTRKLARDTRKRKIAYFSVLRSFHGEIFLTCQRLLLAVFNS